MKSLNKRIKETQWVNYYILRRKRNMYRPKSQIETLMDMYWKRVKFKIKTRNLHQI